MSQKVQIVSLLTSCFVMTGLSGLSGLSGCAQPSVKEQEAEQRQNLKKDVDDEVMVGREISAKLLGNFGHYKRSPQATEYLNYVGYTLAKTSGRPELKFRFAILDTDDENAFAAPGGFIFVTRGLLKTLRSESELAGVLAHEIAHVNEKHMYNAIMPKREMNANEVIARMFSGGRGDLGASIGKIIDAGLKILLEEGYGKEKEFAADQAGAMFASVSGYDPGALETVLGRIEKSSHAVTVSKTHPPYRERIQGMEKFIRDNGLARRSENAVMNTRFERAVASVRATKS